MLDPSRPRHNYYCYSTCDDASSASASARSDALLRAGALCRLGGGASSSAGAGALPYAPKFSSSASAAAAEPDMSRVGAHPRARARGWGGTAADSEFCEDGVLVPAGSRTQTEGS